MYRMKNVRKSYICSAHSFISSLFLNVPDFGQIRVSCIQTFRRGGIIYNLESQTCATLNEIQNLIYYEQNKRKQIVLRLVYFFDAHVSSSFTYTRCNKSS